MAERSIKQTIEEFKAEGWEVHQRNDGSVLLTKSPERVLVGMAESVQPKARAKPQGTWKELKEVVKEVAAGFLTGRQPE